MKQCTMCQCTRANTFHSFGHMIYMPQTNVYKNVAKLLTHIFPKKRNLVQSFNKLNIILVLCQHQISFFAIEWISFQNNFEGFCHFMSDNSGSSAVRKCIISWTTNQTNWQNNTCSNIAVLLASSLQHRQNFVQLTFFKHLITYTLCSSIKYFLICLLY